MTVKYATEGNFESLRRCFFTVRALMSKKLIYPHGLSKKEIQFIHNEIRENETWNIAQAYKLYHILKKYSATLNKYGYDFKKVEEPRNPVLLEKSRPSGNPSFDPVITYMGDKFYIKFKYSNRIVQKVKEIPGARFDKIDKIWTAPIGSSNEVKKFAEIMNFKLGQSAQSIMIDVEQNLEQSYSAERIELSLPFSHPDGYDLYDYQTVGVDFGIRCKRSWIADEMGLGKTIQGIGTALGINRWPWLIICPKSLRNNWKDEIETWTNHKAMILTKKNFGQMKRFIEYGYCDFLIINYDGIKTFFIDNIEERKINGRKKPSKFIHTNGLEKIFKGVIIDEFHEIRNVRTTRFKCINKVIKHMEFRQLLTGTPLVNDPGDIASGLMALDYINEFGGYQGFRKKYQGITKNSWKSKSQPQHLKDLNVKLRSICMVRREKHQVLKELPDKVRTVVKMDIDNRSEYDHAMINLQSYLTEKGASSEQINNAMRAELLVRMNVLKQLSAKGKMSAVNEFIENIIDQDEKLVVFCWHHNTIQSIKSKFPDALEISGKVNDEEIDRAKYQFQNDPSKKLILITYKRGGFGLTLTAASLMLMVELGWNPATQDQAEDRIHRIGQNNNAQIYYALGKDTIDEWIYSIVEKKRKMSNESTGTTGEVETSVQNDLIKALINKNNEGNINKTAVGELDTARI